MDNRFNVNHSKVKFYHNPNEGNAFSWTKGKFRKSYGCTTAHYSDYDNGFIAVGYTYLSNKEKNYIKSIGRINSLNNMIEVLKFNQDTFVTCLSNGLITGCVFPIDTYINTAIEQIQKENILDEIESEYLNENNTQFPKNQISMKMDCYLYSHTDEDKKAFFYALSSYKYINLHIIRMCISNYISFLINMTSKDIKCLTDKISSTTVSTLSDEEIKENKKIFGILHMLEEFFPSRKNIIAECFSNFGITKY